MSQASKASPQNSTNFKGPAIASCPSGKPLIGGGARVEVGSGAKLQIALTSSGPSGSGWSASAFEVVATSEAWSLEVFAICVSVPER